MEKSAPQRESRIERTDRFWVSVATWRRERIKNLFLAAILLLDAFLPLQLYVSLPIPYNILGTLIALGILLYLEVKCYNAVWGKHGRWSLETYSLPLDQKKKEEETPQQEG
jgi:hypothetical protein